MTPSGRSAIGSSIQTNLAPSVWRSSHHLSLSPGREQGPTPVHVDPPSPALGDREARPCDHLQESTTQVLGLLQQTPVLQLVHGRYVPTCPSAHPSKGNIGRKSLSTKPD